MTMRIAFAIHDARPGGGQDRYALELVNRLSATHNVTLFARSAEGLAPGVDFRRIITPNRPPFLRAWRFAAGVRQAVGRERWDIVHTIGGAVPGATVITAQYCQAAWLSAAHRWPSELVGPAERLYREAVTRLAMRAERQAASHPSLRAVIGVSHRTLGEWRSHYGAAPPVEAVAPNGVDPDRMRPGGPAERERLRVELNVPASARLLLLIGALVRKGVETALRTLGQLDSNVYLVAVGAGPHAHIRGLAERQGVANRLRLVSPVSDIERFYQGSDIFLFPTRYEPFGMVVAEAWAAGVPVVAAGTAGALEWASPDEDALVIEDPTDAEGFAEGVDRLLKDPDLAAQLARRGRALAEQLTWDRVVRETEAVYERVVTRRR